MAYETYRGPEDDGDDGSDDRAADFAAQWQSENYGGGQVEISSDSGGNITDIGPTIYPDGEGEN